jgi:hypothetical protein
VRQAYAASLRRHHLGEFRFRSGHAFGHGNARIVARLHDDALDQLVDARLGVDGHERVVDYVRVVDSTYQATSTALCVEDTLKGKPAPRFGGDARAIRVKVDLF